MRLLHGLVDAENVATSGLSAHGPSGDASRPLTKENNASVSNVTITVSFSNSFITKCSAVCCCFGAASVEFRVKAKHRATLKLSRALLLTQKQA
jgi:hypothetical protein